ncbi:hypothetical protein QDX21_05950 [Auritidibacter ignavus]|uniref:Uncharacterized protein n=1 Tax=Auritidibacter ignavus TaxID=678932 RepID=A0AAJ6AP85_9MICC|nr:hypothetical protein [Auritidibacter ignavus]WGH91854.1 hypothetical protein QDX23_05725 [Auritidibacter ignavus]WGH94328.1 hypothetical protein QDX21_05950 [Auritidibacter ignavus]
MAPLFPWQMLSRRPPQYGYVTPAAKLQRNRVIEDFQDQIESLYSSGSRSNA